MIRAALLAAAALIATVAGADTVGTKRIEADVTPDLQVNVRVFYPVSGAEEIMSYGPWELPIVRGRAALPGDRPLVVISHGLGGRDWNHHLLAQRLVKRGYVVAAVQHPDDLLRVGNAGHFDLRKAELWAAIDAVYADPEFAETVDPDRVGAFGFSLGGFTALALAGGAYDAKLAEDHCNQNSAADSIFCAADTGLPFTTRMRRMTYRLPSVEVSKGGHPKISALAIAAPLGAVFSDLADVRVPALLWEMNGDPVLVPEFHSKRIAEMLPDLRAQHSSELDHHYAFLSPFPESIRNSVGEPAQDPPGFDRLEFLNSVNGNIEEFFVSALGVGTSATD
ncbi:MAG: hypothetical protein AAF393_06520 [Pseudomonadota bacterium]